MLDLNSLSLPELFEALTADGCVDRALDSAFDEDLRSPGDITSRSIIPIHQHGEARIVFRQPGIAAGLAILPRFAEDDEGETTVAEATVRDGEACAAGQVVGRLAGNLRSILSVERILLNLVGRLSGIATLTRQYVDAIAGTKAVICDTRKTTPGLRNMEKYAVRCGGGTLHRLGLYDAALFKDNHLAGIPLPGLAKQLRIAIQTIRSQHEVRFVEVEVDALEQLREVLGLEDGLVDIVLLDNMSVQQLSSAIDMRNWLKPGVLLEASGGVNLANVRAIAETGVDRISIGAITHASPWLDVGLDMIGAA